MITYARACTGKQGCTAERVVIDRGQPTRETHLGRAHSHKRTHTQVAPQSSPSRATARPSRRGRTIYYYYYYYYRLEIRDRPEIGR